MTDITWTYPALSLLLDAIPKDTNTLIDIGCGKGIVGALCKIYRNTKHTVGIDAFEPYLDFCREHNLYDEYLSLDLNGMSLSFKDKEFEVATCIEVIEHLPKKNGEILLDEIERISKVAIITTPNVFFKQPKYDNNPYQNHVSIWNVKYFKKRGYSVFGIGESRIFGARLRYYSLNFLSKHFPGLSQMLLCVKTK